MADADEVPAGQVEHEFTPGSDDSDEDVILSEPSDFDDDEDQHEGDEMFDADDTAAQEGYRGGQAAEDAEDDDDGAEYAEAQENHYSTPAGSFAGDDDHVIDEMHRVASEAAEAAERAAALQRPTSSGGASSAASEQSSGGGGAAAAAATPQAAQAQPRQTPSVTQLSLDANSALSSLNFIVNRSVVPDPSLLAGATQDTLEQHITNMLQDKVQNLNQERIAKLADQLREVVDAFDDVNNAAGAPHEDGIAASQDSGGSSDSAARAPTEEEEEEPEVAQQSHGGNGIHAPLPPTASEAQPTAAQEQASAAPQLPQQPKRSAMPSLPPRGAPRGGPTLPPRPSGGGPSLPPRPQPAAGTAGGNGSAASSAAVTAAGPEQRSSGAGPSLPARATAGENRAPNLPSRSAAPAPRPQNPPATAAGSGGNGSALSNPAAATAPAAPEEPDENADLRRRVQDLRVMLLRITKRLGVNVQSSVVQQVLMRLDMAERIRIARRGTPSRSSPLDAAKEEAAALEAASVEGESLPYTCTVMLLGLGGCGKSSLINCLLDRQAVNTDPFAAGTKKLQVVEGDVKGIKMRFIDTPGLLLSPDKVGHNQRILTQAKAASKKHKPDIVLWVDRMDVLRRPGSDLHVLKQVTAVLGAATWFNTVLVMTHAAKPPPDGPAGPMTYDAYVNHRMSSLQQGVRVAAQDLRLMNPAALAETHPNCRKDERGEPLLPNGTPWRQQLMMLGLSSKLLVDAEKALDIRKASGANSQMAQFQMFGRPQKLPPIPYLLSNHIQPRKPQKFPEDERDVLSEKAIAKLEPAEARKAALRKRRQYLQMRAADLRAEEEGSGQSQVAVAAPDLPLAPSFDADIGYNRYHSLDAPGGWLAQPFVESNAVEHDDGVEGMTIQRTGIARGKRQFLGGIPYRFQSQVHKDKSTATVLGELEGSVHHSRRVVTTGGIDMQTVGSDHLWAVKAETRAKNFGTNRTSLGALAARLVDGGGAPTSGPFVYGLKMEDRLRIRRGLKAVVSAGMMTTHGTRSGSERAIAGNARLAQLLGVDDSTALSVEGSLMKFRGDLAIGGNISGQTNLTPQTQLTGRFNLNSKKSGGITLRVTSHDRPEVAYAFVAPLLGLLWGKIRGRGDFDDL